GDASSDKVVDRQAADIKIDLAGPLAERLANPSPLNELIAQGSRGDWRNVRRTARDLNTPREAEILIVMLALETAALVQQHKQHGLDCVRALLRAMGLEECYAAGGLASVQAIEEIIEGVKDRIAPNPNAIVVIDEVGSWLLRIMTGNIGNVNEIPAHLQ